MATYTYQCVDCGTPFEVQATIQEKELGKGEKFMCPKCQSQNVKQEFSVTHFVKNIFKGSESEGNCCSGKKSCDTGCAPAPDDKAKGGTCCG